MDKTQVWWSPSSPPLFSLHVDPRAVHQDVIIGVPTESQDWEGLLFERWRTRRWTGGRKRKLLSVKLVCMSPWLNYDSQEQGPSLISLFHQHLSQQRLLG